MKKYEKKLKIYLLTLLLFVAAISISSVLFIESAYFTSKVKSYLSSYVSAVLKKKVTIQRLKFSIFSPQIDVYGINIKNVAKIKRVNINLGYFNILQRKIIINKINIINPYVDILIKNNRIDNYKNIYSVIKALTKKRPASLISVAFNKIKITGGNLNLNDADKNILLKIKKLNFTAYKKYTLVPFLYRNSGIYFNYNMPYILLKSDKFKIDKIFRSYAARIHYYKNFIKYREIGIGNSYFSIQSNGILELNKKNKFPEIIKKIKDTSTLNIKSLSELSKDFNGAPPVKGKMNAKITLIGNIFGKITGGAAIHLNNAVFFGGEVNSGIIKCRGNFLDRKSFAINFKKIDLKTFHGDLKSTGKIDFIKKTGEFKSVLKNIDIGTLIDFYYNEKIPQFKGAASGNVTTFLHFGKNFYIANLEKLVLNRPVEQIKYKNRKGETSVYYINYVHKILVKGSVLINDKYVLLKNIGILSKTLNGSAEGKIDYIKNYLNIRFHSEYRELPMVSLITQYSNMYFKPSGNGTINGDIGGKFNDISFSFNNKFKTLHIDKYLGSYTGYAGVDITAGGNVLFKKVYLSEKNRAYNKKGSLYFTGDIIKNKISKNETINGKFNAKDMHISSKNPSAPFSSVFDMKGTINGELKDPLAQASVKSKNVKVYGKHISSVNFLFSLNKKSLNIKYLKGLYSGAIFRGYGSLNFKAINRNNYNVKIISSGIDLASLNYDFLKKYRIKGTAVVDLHIGGLFSLPDVSGNIALNGININNYTVGNASAEIYSSKNKMKLKLSALNNEFKTKAAILLKKGYPYNFLTNVNLLKVNYRKTLFGLSGAAYGSGKLLNIKNSYIFSKFNYIYLKHGPFYLKNVKNVKISYINKTVEFGGFKLKGGINYFQLRGYISPSKYHIILNDRTDLWVLNIFTPKIINSSGFLTASAVIFGKITAPSIYGYADIKKGLVEPSVYSSLAASRIFARLTFNNNMIQLERAKFRMLNGIFSAHGIVRLHNFKPSYYSLETGFDSAIYRKSNYFYAKLNGKLWYSGSAARSILYGYVDIKKTLYDKKINLSSFLLSYKKYSVIKPVIKKGIFNPKLNIGIASNKSIFIKNNIVNADLSAKLRLVGTLYNPVLTGTANAEKGKIFFRGTMFKLSHADLDFNNRYKINPYFDIAAATHINQYLIRMNASGSLLNFNVNLSSAPPLSELNIVSMLALGAPSTSVYAGSAGGIAASEAASAIGGGVERSITGAISSYFGFKNLSVAPSYSVVTHSAAPQITVSKNLTKKLSVSYSDIASSQSSQSVTLTYSLNRHISIIGIWENNELAPNNSNIYSEVGGNIVFHFRFY